ncbi:RNA polymerase sigma factor [Nocardia asiatica]
MVDEPDQISAEPDELTEHATAAEQVVTQKEAFAVFYRTYLPRLVGFLVNRGASVDDAAEVAQEAMARAWKSWSAISFAPAWIFPVAIRIYAERLRTIRDTPVSDVGERSVLIPADSDIDEWIAGHSYHQIVRELPERQRQIMEWRMQGYDNDQIAQQLCIKPATVLSLLRRARRTLSAHRGGERE